MKANAQIRTFRTWISIATPKHPEVGRHLPTSGTWISTSKFQLLRVGSWELQIQLPTADLRKLVFNFQLLTARHFDLAKTTTKPVANKPSRGRGPPRVLTGTHGFPRALLPGGFSALKLPFFRVFTHFFAWGKY